MKFRKLHTNIYIYIHIHIHKHNLRNSVIHNRKLQLHNQQQICFIYMGHVVINSVMSWSELLARDPEIWVRFPVLPDCLRISGSGTGSTQPREYYRGAV
jgi:hypothetical protein